MILYDNLSSGNGYKVRLLFALQVMDQHLSTAPYFAGADFSIADIALYAYTHVAAEGGFELTAYAAIGAWLQRCAARPGHILITADPSR